MKIPVMLSFKEMWRNRGRYLLFSLVIALTVLAAIGDIGRFEDAKHLVGYDAFQETDITGI